MKTDFMSAARSAFGLAVEASVVLPETAQAIISKVYRQAVAVSVEAGFFTKDTSEKIIQKAYRNMNALSSAVAAVKPEAVATQQTASGETSEGKG
jgi:hypothetical protein